MLLIAGMRGSGADPVLPKMICGSAILAAFGIQGLLVGVQTGLTLNPKPQKLNVEYNAEDERLGNAAGVLEMD